MQLVVLLENHNVPINDNFNKDMGFVYESLKSAILRAVGKHHHIQDFIDNIKDMNKEEG